MIEIIKSKVIRVKDENTPENYGHYVVEPLERGFGITLGNSIRRVLLSSIPGWAITSVKIDGVLHEFQLIEGVTEDMIEITLNLKDVVVRLNENYENYTLKVKKEGPGELLAGDFAVPGIVEIFNPEHKIATIAKKYSLEMEVTISRGRGYKTSSQIKEMFDDGDVSRIYLDSNFSPILKVNYNVTDTRVGQNFDYDKLEMEIWTNKTVTPDVALNTAVRLLQEYLNLFVTIEDMQVETVGMITEKEEKRENNYDIPIRDLEFSVRSRNCLKRANIKTLGQLTQMTAEELLSIKNFGRKSLNEIREKLRQFNLTLKGEEDTLKDSEEKIGGS